ncbi:VOC family protein [Sulfidibacter corallicola]|uniref:VOC family protein n=1 Tax=Sulfidibacter corallicola TaxID=2818388 RepID=A0A8A4TIJ7_SULCO|nr:VOC family protein [Sulfidibacter corallicola]QTD48671.1 VOC family protein [Sulfidibacter corallicola]
MSQDPNLIHGNFSWMSHIGGDRSEVTDFYRTLIGWELVDQTMANGATYTVIKNGEQMVGGLPPVTETPAQWLPYITVDDVDARVKTAETRGAKVVEPARTVEGVGRMATLQDPFGASFALITYESQMK